MRRAAWQPLFSHRKAKRLLARLSIFGGDGDFHYGLIRTIDWSSFMRQIEAVYASRPDVIGTAFLEGLPRAQKATVVT
jgi:hypothetical protein